MNRRSQLAAVVVSAFILTAIVRGQSITIAPANPTLLVGQTLQLTPTGAVVPSAIATGAGHTCVLYTDQSIRCTGQNSQGQVGNGDYHNVFEPALVAGTINPVSVGTGLEHTCTLVGDGRMQCWGANYTGQLGTGVIGGFATSPQMVQGISNATRAIVGGFFTCAMLPDRTIQCWGRNQDGQLGNGDSTTDTASPGAVVGLGPVADFAAGGYHACALMDDRSVRCWGRNVRGQVGDGTSNSPVAVPHAVTGLSGPVAALSLGTYHSCALMQDRTVQCWGQSDWGQIGAPGLAYSAVPQTVNGISNAVAVGTGFMHSCAVLADGTVRCWGRNDFGQLGDGTTTSTATPVQVQGIVNPRAIALGLGHTCALLPDASVRCWGENDLGEFGVGTATNSLTPLQMHATGMTWTSSNAAIAAVSAAGVLSGVARGTATVSLSDSFGSAGSTGATVRELLTLTMLRQGDGSGSVVSAPSGIDCGTTCSAQFVSDSPVTLTATPAANSTFAGWTGCDAVSDMTCTVNMTNARMVTAIFMLRRFTLTVTKSGIGRGTVTSNPQGIDCGTACASDFVTSTVVTLTASPALGSLFTGWSGCDAENGSTCTVAMNARRTVSANFLGLPLP